MCMGQLCNSLFVYLIWYGIFPAIHKFYSLSESLYQVEVFAKLPHQVVKDPQWKKCVIWFASLCDSFNQFLIA